MSKLNINKITLKREYIKKHKSIHTIANKYKLGYGTIQRLLHKYEIKVRPAFPYLGKYNGSYKHGLTCKDKKYFCSKCENSISFTSAVYGHGMCFECIRKLQIGANASNWQGGKSFEEYNIEFNETLKRQIRDRDNHECQVCHVHEKDLEEILSIHHIDYDKQNSLSENLISLCLKCHVKTNGNRNFWTKYFLNLIQKIYQLI